MKKLYILLLIPLIYGSFVLGKQLKKKSINYNNSSTVSEINTNDEYIIKEENPFVVIIPSYNNIKWYKKNIQSVLDQKYSNYRVIYIDDSSKDGTYEAVKQYLEDNDVDNRVTLIHNEKNNGALSNLYSSIHSCEDNEIIVTLDGDDWLAHEFVLTRLNDYYYDKNVWLTYGQYLDYPSLEWGMCLPIDGHIVKKYGIRKHPWVASHLRTFYAGLFKKIKIEDFFYKNKFMDMSWDYAFMMPMLEMAGKHAYFVKDVLYMYNRLNPISDDKKNLQLQVETASYVRNKKPYLPLTSFPHANFAESREMIDIIISSESPLNLAVNLSSIFEKVDNFQEIFVIYNAKNEFIKDDYNKIKALFPNVNFLTTSEDLSTIIKENYDASSYILLLKDDYVFNEDLDLNKCIKLLKESNSTVFSLKKSYGQKFSIDGSVKVYSSNIEDIFDGYIVNKDMISTSKVNVLSNDFKDNIVLFFDNFNIQKLDMLDVENINLQITKWEDKFKLNLDDLKKINFHTNCEITNR